MNKSDDFKLGFYEGYMAAKKGETAPWSQPHPTTPWTQPYPSPSDGVKCHKCGVFWQGSMGYCCPDNHCPVQPKVSFSNNEKL